jgi:hypothetical protein
MDMRKKLLGAEHPNTFNGKYSSYIQRLREIDSGRAIEC